MPDVNRGPATPSLAHEAQAEAVKVCRDVYKGTRHLREQAREYLPQFPKEGNDAYKSRLQRATLFNAFRRTIDAQVGMVTRSGPTVSEDMPERMAEHMEDVDFAGRDLPTFTADHLTDALIDGHAIIFVDMQPPPDVSDAMEERQRNLRPYWVQIQKQDVLRHSTVSIGGRTVVREFAYHERTVERVNEFQERPVHRVREYLLGDVSEEGEEARLGVRFRIWKLKPDKKWHSARAEDFVSDGEGVMSISRIPVAATYTGRTGVLTSEPPLEDLAWQNVHHYQTESDNANLAHTAKVPILMFTGVPKAKIQEVEIGPGSAVVLEDENARAEWLQASGEDFEAFASDLQRIEHRMAVMGLSMLMSESRAAETAASKRIDKSESDSQLMAIARNLQNALNEARSFHGEWMDIEDSGSIEVNKDFEDEPFDSAVFKEFRELWAARGISWETLVRTLQTGEMLPDDFDVDKERERIAAEDGIRMDAAEADLFGDA